MWPEDTRHVLCLHWNTQDSHLSTASLLTHDDRRLMRDVMSTTTFTAPVRAETLKT